MLHEVTPQDFFYVVLLLPLESTPQDKKQSDISTLTIFLQIKKKILQTVVISGGPDRDRTGDLLRDRQAC